MDICSLFVRAVALLAWLSVGCSGSEAREAPPATSPVSEGEVVESEAEVVVVGAGLSGLMAARSLVAEGVESVVVFEARERVGGRTLNQQLADGVVVEGGAQWVGPTQTALLALADELGVDTFETYLEGNSRVSVFGMGMNYGSISPEPGRLSEQLDSLAEQVPLDAPWDAERAAEWDAITVAQWMADAGLDSDERETLEMAVATTLASTPDQVSMLWFLFYVHSAGGFLTLDGFEGAAQESRFVGGSQRIALGMYEQLRDRVDFRFEQPVTAIEQTEEAVVVRSQASRVVARRVIVALGPRLAQRIDFSPPLPAERQGLQERWGEGPGYKAHLLYDRPFWRDQGLNGTALGFGIAGFALDNSPPDGSRGVLVVFTEPELLPEAPEDRASALAEALVPAFGRQVRETRGFVDKDWASDPWTAGCVSPNGPGVLTGFGRSLRAPVGRVHWAGAETALIWNGYMEGAVRSGERAAMEVVAAGL